jgi:hypothetical protein
MAQENSKQATVKEAAKKYVDEQLEVLKKHGSAIRISKSEYNSIVKQVVRASGK